MKRPGGATRSKTRRLRAHKERWLRRYGYLTEWNAALRKFKRQREALKGKP